MTKPGSPNEAESDCRPTVLVVEDDRDVRNMLARVLDAHGWRVLTARDGLTAFQVLDDKAVDAVVSDLHLPGPTGEMVLEFARRRRPECRAVLISGWVTRRARERAQAVGALILEKPIDTEAMLEELRGGPKA